MLRLLIYEVYEVLQQISLRSSSFQKFPAESDESCPGYGASDPPAAFGACDSLWPPVQGLLQLLVKLGWLTSAHFWNIFNVLRSLAESLTPFEDVRTR